MTNKHVNVLMLDFESSVRCIERIKSILDTGELIIPVLFEQAIFKDYTSSNGKSIKNFSSITKNTDARSDNTFLFEAYTAIAKALAEISNSYDKLIVNVIYPDSLAARADLLLRMLSETRPNDSILRSHLNQVK